MRIAYITAGAAGMYCGSCMRDNTLVAALCRQGHDALLIPTYTPIRTDEEDVSQQRVFFGGINVYLQQKSWLFRHTPWLLDRILDLKPLLRWVSRFAARTKYSELGDLTASMLRGRHGNQRKEIEKLTRYLAHEVKPDVVILTNALLSGIAPSIRQSLGIPVIITLQGDDIFLDALPELDRRHCIDIIRENDSSVSGYLCTSRDYADRMSRYLGIVREKMHVVYPGINLHGHLGPRGEARSGPPTLGYFARICPEKGFHLAIEAFITLRKRADVPQFRFLASGWLGDNHRQYFDEQRRKIKQAGLADDCEYRPCPSHADKVRFFQSIDLFTVPTLYQEPKGLYVLESWANGVPVVLPAHGIFPELHSIVNGGILVPPNDPTALADAIARLITNHIQRSELGQAGHAAVRKHFHADVMARNTFTVLQTIVAHGSPVVS